jgi:outer membrane protein assembly factor BamB
VIPQDEAPALTRPHGMLYINQQNALTGTVTALCALQMHDGRPRWCQSQVPEVLQTSSLLNSQGIVYVGTKQGLTDTLFALNEKDGSIRWKYSWETRSGAPVRFALAHGRLYLGLEHTSSDVLTTLVAFQATTGQLLWSKALLPQLAADSILLVTEHGQVYVRTSVTPSVYALDEATGALRWTVGLGHQSPGGSDFPQLLVANGRVYADAPDARHTLYALNAGDGARLWSLPLFQTVAAMALSGQTLSVGLRRCAGPASQIRKIALAPAGLHQRRAVSSLYRGDTSPQRVNPLPFRGSRSDRYHPGLQPAKGETDLAGWWLHLRPRDASRLLLLGQCAQLQLPVSSARRSGSGLSEISWPQQRDGLPPLPPPTAGNERSDARSNSHRSVQPGKKPHDTRCTSRGPRRKHSNENGAGSTRLNRASWHWPTCTPLQSMHGVIGERARSAFFLLDLNQTPHTVTLHLFREHLCFMREAGCQLGVCFQRSLTPMIHCFCHARNRGAGSAGKRCRLSGSGMNKQDSDEDFQEKTRGSTCNHRQPGGQRFVDEGPLEKHVQTSVRGHRTACRWF